MSLRAGKINPLNVLDLRRVRFPAHHFHYTEIMPYSLSKLVSIESWIFHNLNSRYYIGQGISLDKNVISYVLKIGFEQQKELSYFKLAAPIDFN